jgi:hypothetical protein
VWELRKKKVLFSNEFLLEHLRNLDKKLGRAPTRKDVSLAHKEGRRIGINLPTNSVYNYRFGGHNASLEKADIKPAQQCSSYLESADTPGEIRKALLEFFADCRKQGIKISAKTLWVALSSGKLRISPTAFKNLYGTPKNALLIYGVSKVRGGLLANDLAIYSPRARR